MTSDVESLPQESIAIQEHLRDVELARSPKLWARVGVDPISFLKTKIAPLMRYKQNVEPNEASFTQKCEELSLAILTNDHAEIRDFRTQLRRCLGAFLLQLEK